MGDILHRMVRIARVLLAAGHSGVGAAAGFVGAVSAVPTCCHCRGSIPGLAASYLAVACADSRAQAIEQ